MPSYLRLFYYQELVKVRKEENEQVKKANERQKTISRPNINPRFKQ
tara:strand:- start:13 stop:150 length:138 start_codon:yes stop_codon:yes gene_type:complete